MKRPKSTYIRSESAGKMRSVTVSYKHIGIPLYTSRVGYGNTFDKALEDADSQLSDGMWRRICVSNPNSIATDLMGTRVARLSRGTLRRGEGVVIQVEKRISKPLDIDDD